VRSNVFTADRIFGDTFLIAAHLNRAINIDKTGGMKRTDKTEDLKSPLVDFIPSIGNDANNDLFPSLGTPGFGTTPRTEMSNVFDDPDGDENKTLDIDHQTHAFIVLQNSTSSSLYMVMTMNNSVCLFHR